MLAVGSLAPNFTLEDEKGNKLSLSDFLGKKVLIYFYPKDNTPGCTKEACSFKNEFAEFTRLGVNIIGISKDSTNSHLNFKNKYELPFILLADPMHQVIDTYGAWQEKKNYGKTYMGTARIAYLIGEDGSILKVYPKIKAAEAAREILKDLTNE